MNRKIEEVPSSYLVGSGPFCKASESDCMPGYKFVVDKESKGCWTGSKGKCVFDKELWRKSDTYRYLTSKYGEEYAKKNMPGQVYVFGTAPFCGSGVCDVFKAGKWPIGPTTTGRGEQGCWSGTKFMGIDPVSDEQRDKIEDYRKACMLSDDLATQSWIEFWKAFGKTADAVGAVVTGGVSSAVSGGVRGMIEGLKSEPNKGKEEKKEQPKTEKEEKGLNEKIKSIVKPLEQLVSSQNFLISENKARENILNARKKQKSSTKINKLSALFK